MLTQTPKKETMGPRRCAGETSAVYTFAKVMKKPLETPFAYRQPTGQPTRKVRGISKREGLTMRIRPKYSPTNLSVPICTPAATKLIRLASQMDCRRPNLRPQRCVRTTPMMVPTLRKELMSCCGVVAMFQPIFAFLSLYPYTFRKPTMAWNPAIVAVSYLMERQQGSCDGEGQAVPVLAVCQAHGQADEDAFPVVLDGRLTARANSHVGSGGQEVVSRRTRRGRENLNVCTGCKVNVGQIPAPRERAFYEDPTSAAGSTDGILRGHGSYALAWSLARRSEPIQGDLKRSFILPSIYHK